MVECLHTICTSSSSLSCSMQKDYHVRCGRFPYLHRFSQGIHSRQSERGKPERAIIEPEERRMTLDTIKQNIDSERTLLLPLKEKVTTPERKQQCQEALNYLDDAE